MELSVAPESAEALVQAVFLVSVDLHLREMPRTQ